MWERAQKLLLVDHHINYGRDIVLEWCRLYAKKQSEPIKILDIGCGNCYDLLNIKNTLDPASLQLYGIEYTEACIKTAEDNHINIFNINIEYNKIPVKDEYFDIIIANQVIEHSKELFWIFSEVSRTLKKGGILIIGVPNLASLHNRLLLLAGEQPTSIETLGPHVRGFTAPSLKRFIETDGYFKVQSIKGSNYYPFPVRIARRLSRIFPRSSVSIFVLAVRTQKEGNFIKVLDDRPYETPFYKG